ncbi:MAG: hypothetical protein HC804_07285 [Anaerolineae bacterium]|nr:hypothetical protein [Anaerolineae bacterium]
MLSGSFWWRAAADETAIEPGRRIAHNLVRQGPKREGLRFWFEAATQDEVSDRDQNGVIDAIQDTQELMDEIGKAGHSAGRRDGLSGNAGRPSQLRNLGTSAASLSALGFPDMKIKVCADDTDF